MSLKTKEEIAIMREGGARHAQILRELANMVKDGVSTLTLEEEALAMIKANADKPAFLGYKPYGAKRPFPAALCVSINNEVVHGIPNEAERIIRDGDIVSLDLGLIHKGLITDSAITVGCGELDDEGRELIEKTKQALMEGIKAARVGNTVGDIGSAISAYAEKTKFSLVTYLGGHGVGHKVHEDPQVPNDGVRGEGEKLVAGMVLAIEPMLNTGSPEVKMLSDGYTFVTKDGGRSAHFEHTIAITEDGPQILTEL